MTNYSTVIDNMLNILNNYLLTSSPTNLPYQLTANSLTIAYTQLYKQSVNHLINHHLPIPT